MHRTKKITAFILTTAITATALSCPASALYDEVKAEPIIGDDYVFTSGDWQYYLLGENPVVCGYTGGGEKITIPSEIDGKKVTKVSGRKTSNEILSFVEKKFSFFSGKAENVKEVIIPEGVLTIGIYTFQHSNIEKVTLPKSLISVGYCAFWSCKGLETVTLPENVKIIGRSAFNESGLKEIYLNEGLVSIGEFAFNATQIKQVYIPDTVNEIGMYAFAQTDLEEVTLPKGLVKAETEIFYGCEKLKTAYIPEGVTELSGEVFSNCKIFEELYLPSTLNSLSNMSECSQALKTVNYGGNGEHWKNVFGNDTAALFSYDRDGFTWTNEIEMNYNIPVPEAKPPIYPGKRQETDAEAVILIIITALGMTLTAVLALSLMRKAMAKKRVEEKTEEENFHLQILGVWQCGRCKTPNSPIANYCYKCGRKRGNGG